MLLELPSFIHIKAESIEEVVSQLHKYGDEAKVIAGGTDLLALMKDRVEYQVIEGEFSINERN